MYHRIVRLRRVNLSGWGGRVNLFCCGVRANFYGSGERGIHRHEATAGRRHEESTIVAGKLKAGHVGNVEIGCDAHRKQ